MKIEFYDTTLRDGAQAEGISFSVEDKKQIFALLDGFGIDLVEGGDPASNPKDAEFFAECRSPKLVAFGATRHRDKQVFEDSGLARLLEADTRTVCVFGKASLSQVKDVLGVTPEENLTMISESVDFLKLHGKRVIFDAEHFYDGYREDRLYALTALSAAYMAGADTLVLCDTNGGTSPADVYEITADVVDKLSAAVIGVLAGAAQYPGAGLDLLKKVGDRVEQGETLYRVHAVNSTDFAFANSVVDGYTGYEISGRTKY